MANSQKLDLTGKRFGKLIVISFDSMKNGRSQWKCLCDCGKEKVLPRPYLISGQNKSCGCGMIKKGKESHKYKGYEEITGTYWSDIQSGAKKRDIEFNISKEYVWQLFLNQNRYCALTKLILTFPKSRSDRNATASLDRIDSTKGYIVGNVQWIHKHINLMKNEFSQDYFIDMCKKVSTSEKTSEAEEVRWFHDR